MRGMAAQLRHAAARVAASSSAPPRRRARPLHRARAAPRGAAAEAPAAAPAACDLSALRRALSQAGVDALVVPSDDPHASEYPAFCYARREFVSGFTGSAGTAAVCVGGAAALSTDGRYFLQAEMQLDGAQWQLLRAGQPGVPSVPEWLCEQLPMGAAVGIDPAVHSVEDTEALRAQLGAKGIGLVLLESNPVDTVWGAARPPPPAEPLRVHTLEHAGQSASEKLGALRGEMAAAGADLLVLSQLDEVAWALNLRGADVPHCPVGLAFAIVGADFARLYVDASKVTADVKAHLAEAGVDVHPYAQCVGQLKDLTRQGKVAWLDPSTASAALFAAAESGAEARAAAEYARAKKARGPGVAVPAEDVREAAIVRRQSPAALRKALKNEAELAGMRACHLRDGAAVVRFLKWLGDAVDAGEALDECSVSDRLEAERRAAGGYKSLSFDTIAGCGPNGAIIHYRAEPESCRALAAGDMFLLDSGAQYEDGTTDVTRTMFLGSGEPDARHRRCFTAVLKGNIAVDTAVYPEGTPGCALDVLARGALWRAGLNYLHGTGHGVGAALNVHEGPQSISPRFGNLTPLEAGMVLSNEPGYYEDGAFGIRIENLLVVREMKTENNFGGKAFFGFERLTHIPIQKALIDTSMLTPDEANWVDTYHTDVRERLAPLLQSADDAEALAFLEEATAPLDRVGLGEASGARAEFVAAA